MNDECKMMQVFSFHLPGFVKKDSGAVVQQLANFVGQDVMFLFKLFNDLR